MSSVPMSATPSIRPIIPKQILDLQLSTHTTFVQPRATVFSVPRFKKKKKKSFCLLFEVPVNEGFPNMLDFLLRRYLFQRLTNSGEMFYFMTFTTCSIPMFALWWIVLSILISTEITYETFYGELFDFILRDEYLLFLLAKCVTTLWFDLWFENIVI
jgi:hypothetical protein